MRNQHGLFINNFDMTLLRFKSITNFCCVITSKILRIPKGCIQNQYVLTGTSGVFLKLECRIQKVGKELTDFK